MVDEGIRRVRAQVAEERDKLLALELLQAIRERWLARALLEEKLGGHPLEGKQFAYRGDRYEFVGFRDLESIVRPTDGPWWGLIEARRFLRSGKGLTKDIAFFSLDYIPEIFPVGGNMREHDAVATRLRCMAALADRIAAEINAAKDNGLRAQSAHVMNLSVAAHLLADAIEVRGDEYATEAGNDHVRGMREEKKGHQRITPSYMRRALRRSPAKSDDRREAKRRAPERARPV